MAGPYTLMSNIPLRPIPSQLVPVTIAGQSCRVNVYQKDTGLYCDVIVDGVTILAGVVCLNGCKIKRNDYLGFAGELVFWDLQGKSDPDYTGLGSRFALMAYS